MVVNPEGNLRIMKNIGWHSDLKHTHYFSSIADQNTYMTNKQKYELNDFTYIREQNIIRVPIVADNLYDCNYISFLNRGFGTKRFYAFITDVKYVNPETSEISFEIDMYQTWWFQIDIGTCFVEREHVADDTIGLHTVEETLDFGDNTVYQHNDLHYDSWNIVLQFAPSYLGQAISGHNPITVVDDELTPFSLMYACDQPTTPDAIVNALRSADLADYEIVGCYIYPSGWAGELAQIIKMSDYGIERPTLYKSSYYGGANYTPKNNKLFCYPYTYMMVASSDGESEIFKWENFRTQNDYTFNLYTMRVNYPSAQITPISYDNGGSDARLKIVNLQQMPEVPMLKAGDTSKHVIKTIAGVIASTIAPQVMLPITALYTASEGINTFRSHDKITPRANPANLAQHFNKLGFEFYSMGIKSEYAEIVDNYLTRFGYKVDRLKRPELNSRQYFNYVKTKECDPTGNAPDEALRTIASMFNSGVTLWHTDSIGGNYDNNPIVNRN